MADHIKTGFTVFDMELVVGYQKVWTPRAATTAAGTSFVIYLDTGAEIIVGRTNNETDDAYLERINDLMQVIDRRLAPNPHVHSGASAP